jgi:predicted alpha/beta-fold hydrolase
LILIAQDDPFVPFAPFRDAEISGNPFITLVAPEHGGHCAFISREAEPNRFWAEAKIVDYCVKQSKMGERGKAVQATGTSSEG